MGMLNHTLTHEDSKDKVKDTQGDRVVTPVCSHTQAMHLWANSS